MSMKQLTTNFSVMKTLWVFKKFYLAAIVCMVALVPQGCKEEKTIQAFHLSEVRLLDGPFREAMLLNRAYIMTMDPDRLLHPFLREAGLTPKAPSYGNWESTGLDGHTAGHYLTSLSLFYASTGDQEALRRLNYMLNELKACQERHGNGYTGGIPGGTAMWEEIAAGNIRAENFSLNGKWVPWYNIHKLFAGLYDTWQYTGIPLAGEMLVGLSDWATALVAGLDEEQMQQMLRAEHGGMNEVFANVAAMTGEDKYLDLARRFSHHAILDPLLAGEDRLDGLHANTQIPKVIGFKRVADVAGDEGWNRASRFFWQTVVKNRSVSIGGNSVREHFHPADNFFPMIADREGPETCNTYNMLRLSYQLFLSDGDEELIGYYERALYNHILSSQHPDHGGLVYFTSMRPGHYRVYSQPEKNFWCCVGSGIENHMKYGELIYSHRGNDLMVNLFIPSSVRWESKGVTLTQATAFPEEEGTTLIVDPDSPIRFELLIRYPDWVAAGGMKILVNGQPFQVSGKPGSYVPIRRKWQKGDTVKVSLPMYPRLEQLPDGSPYVSLMVGPIVLGAKSGTDELVGLVAGDSRMGHVAWGPLRSLQDAPILAGEMNSIAGKLEPIEESPLHFRFQNGVYPPGTDLVLQPFYGIHDARYTIYWQVASHDELERIRQVQMEVEEARLALEAITIDEVSPGEQQPEVERGFRGHLTETGINQNRIWRHARGWFSYNLRNPGREATVLQLTYYGLDRDRHFDILVNDVKIAEVHLDGSQGDQFFTVDYPVPTEAVKDAGENVLVTRFVAHEGSIAGGIYHVRLLRNPSR
jgi:uncharacterized protein